MRPVRRNREIAVALHDVEPATFERCALIRDWLFDHGINRATLLVIPACDLHSFHDRRPDLATWLGELAAGGDAIAQHGFQHRQTRRAGLARQWLAGLQGSRAGEFPGLTAGETHAAVQVGRRVLKLAGIEPRGFVAPAYAYTPALRMELAGSFDWWAGLMRLHRSGREPAADTTGARAITSPALCLGTSSPLKRALSPALVRAGGLVSGRVMRLDLHPADLDHPRHVMALESVLRRAQRRTAITYDDLLV